MKFYGGTKVSQQDFDMLYIPGNQENMMSITEKTMKERAMYPEIHYKLEPFISSACDTIQASGAMPTQQELDDITDGIFDDFCSMHPEMANYMNASDNSNEMPEAVPTQVYFGGYRPGRPGRFRRRGLGRDLISALLLARLFGRRYPYYPYYPYY